MSDLLRVVIWPSEPLARFRGLFSSLMLKNMQQGLLFVKINLSLKRTILRAESESCRGASYRLLPLNTLACSWWSANVRHSVFSPHGIGSPYAQAKPWQSVKEEKAVLPVSTVVENGRSRHGRKPVYHRRKLQLCGLRATGGFLSRRNRSKLMHVADSDGRLPFTQW